MGVQPKKKLFPGKVRKIIHDNVVTFFSNFGPLPLCRPERTLWGGLLVACLVACLLLDTQAPPWWSNNLINRLKYYVLQLGDPYPTLPYPTLPVNLPLTNYTWPTLPLPLPGLDIRTELKGGLLSLFGLNLAVFIFLFSVRTMWFWSILAEKACFVLLCFLVFNCVLLCHLASFSLI